jgi:hypothetical protein
LGLAPPLATPQLPRREDIARSRKAATASKLVIDSQNMSATGDIAVGIPAAGNSGASSGAGDGRRVSPAAETQRRFDLALDLVLANFPRDAVALRFRDRAAWRDPDVLHVAARAFPFVLEGLARRGDVAVVGALIAEGIDPSAGDNCALRAASEEGHLAVVERLLTDPRVNQSANDAIVLASMNGHLSVVERLLADPRVDPAVEDGLAIRFASAMGHLAVVECLLADPRVDPSAAENDAIRAASENGHLAVVERLLVDPRVVPSANDNFAIRAASKEGHLTVVERLLTDPRVNPSADDNAAIREAS